MLSVAIESLILFWLAGWSVLWFARTASARTGYSGSFVMSIKVALPIGAGLLLRYAAELLTGNSQAAEAACLVIGVCGVPTLVRRWASQFRAFKSQPALLHPLTKVFGVFFLLWAPLAAFSVLDPVIVGDAKEIWFFHAKMIFYANGINQEAGFADPAVLFSHPDYPKLLPVIGAAVASIFGAWNDHLPKFSIALILLPPFAFVADLIVQRRYLVGLAYLGLVISGGGSLVYTGYVDPLLSAGGSLSALALYFATEDSEPSLLGFAAMLAALMVNLKSEGLPLVALTLPPLLWADHVNLKGNASGMRVATVFIVLGGVCFAAWAVISNRLGLVNDMSGDKGAAWTRFLSRVGDPKNWQICLNYFSQWLGSGFFLAGILVASIYFCVTRPGVLRFKIALAANLGALSYAAFLILVYLSTHHDLAWHLHFSSYRTLLPAQTLIGVSLLLFLSRSEATHPGVAR